MSLHGHKPWGVLTGFLLTVAAVLGLLGLLGDSPLDLRGDEQAPDADDARPGGDARGVWVLLFGAALYRARGLLRPVGSVGDALLRGRREILSRDDWITTWWGQGGLVHVKPVLIFWSSALGMGLGTMFGSTFTPTAGRSFRSGASACADLHARDHRPYALYHAVARAPGAAGGAPSSRWCSRRCRTGSSSPTRR